MSISPELLLQPSGNLYSGNFFNTGSRINAPLEFNSVTLPRDIVSVHLAISNSIHYTPTHILISLILSLMRNWKSHSQQESYFIENTKLIRIMNLQMDWRMKLLLGFCKEKIKSPNRRERTVDEWRYLSFRGKLEWRFIKVFTCNTLPISKFPPGRSLQAPDVIISPSPRPGLAVTLCQT